MYESFYGLKENPFRLAPDPAYMYMTAQHREALAGLFYSAYTRPGLTVMIGEAGTGKTTLLNALMRALEKGRFVTAMCNNPTLTREEFYDLILAKLGIDCPSTLKSRQLIHLQEALFKYRSEGRRAVLIVDEAQRLPIELLEEIRLLLNVETAREKLLEIIIAGQPELRDILHRPDLRQLKQRISRLCTLEPLSLHDLRNYLNHRIAHSGLVNQRIFPEGTAPLIYEYTQGIPRLVNSLCDGALQTGFALQSRQITPEIISEAASDLDLARKATANGNGSPAAAAANVTQPPSAATPAPWDLVLNGSGHDGEHVERNKEEVNGNRERGFFSSLINRWK